MPCVITHYYYCRPSISYTSTQHLYESLETVHERDGAHRSRRILHYIQWVRIYPLANGAYYQWKVRVCIKAQYNRFRKLLLRLRLILLLLPVMVCYECACAFVRAFSRPPISKMKNVSCSAEGDPNTYIYVRAHSHKHTYTILYARIRHKYGNIFRVTVVKSHYECACTYEYVYT